MKKYIRSLAVILIVLNLLAVSAYADEVLDLTKKGSVSVTARHGEDTVAGGTMTLYQVGTVTEQYGGYKYIPTEDFEESGVPLNNILYASLAEELAAYAKEAQLTGETKEINLFGHVTFRDLDAGLYLLVQQEAAKGYHPANPFLVTVPGYIDGQYNYDIDATPKLDPLEEIPTVPTTTPPETTVPESSVPETSVPATSVPESSEPETSVPATSVPESSVPETSVPATSVPATSVPETSAPATSKPEATETEPPVTGTTAPGTTAPGTTAPATTAPGTTAGTPSGPSVPTLPQTGQLVWPIPVLGVLGLFFLVGGLALMRDKKKKRD